MSDIILGLPHSSTLGPLLFNVFLAYLFFDVNDNDIASYADDNITPYLVDVDNLISCILVILNLLKSNADKYYLLVSTNDRVSIKCSWVWNRKFNEKLTFNDYISDMLCPKTHPKWELRRNAYSWMLFSSCSVP